MKIKHFLANAFIVESRNTNIAIDPGFDNWFFHFRNYIPKSEWPGITHILVTHGDIDHYWSPDQIAEVSSAGLICEKGLVKQSGGEVLILDPRAREVKYSTRMEKVFPLEIGGAAQIDDLFVETFEAFHGPLKIKLLFGLLEKSVIPGVDERIAIGSAVFKVILHGKTFVNMGDTLLLNEAWDGLKGLKPDVLMIPIGGGMTMDQEQALEAVKLMEPKLVIPCHYNMNFLWIKGGNPADDQKFKRDVEMMGFQCTILQHADEITLD